MNSIKKIINKVLAYVISTLLIVMTALVLWQVITRYIFNQPAVFTEELVIVILTWTAFLGAAYAFGSREHMALVFLKMKLKGVPRKSLVIFIDVLVMVFVFFILIIGGFKLAQGVKGNLTPILRMPKSLTYASPFVSGIIIMIYQLCHIADSIFKKTTHKEESNGN